MSFPILVFNELSIEESDGRSVLDALPQLSRLLGEVRRRWAEVRLASPAGNLGGLQPRNSATTFASLGFSAQGESREAWRYIATSYDKLVVELDHDLGVEHHFEGRTARGLGAAAENDHVSFSIATSGVWAEVRLDLQRSNLEEDGSVREVQCTVRHASDVFHLGSHDEYIGMLEAELSFEEYLARACPKISLIKRARDSIPELERSGKVIAQIRKRLKELNESVEEWHPSESKAPKYRSLVSPESLTRKHLCLFLDDDGVMQDYEMHARYTPTAGRIHFRLIEEPSPRIEIGHIGLKLE